MVTVHIISGSLGEWTGEPDPTTLFVLQKKSRKEEKPAGQIKQFPPTPSPSPRYLKVNIRHCTFLFFLNL